VAVAQATHKIYVTNIGSNSLNVIDGKTNTVTQTIPVGNIPSGVAIDQSTNQIFVTNRLDNTVSVIDGASGAVTHTIAVGRGPVGVSVDQKSHKAYVANSDLGENFVSVIDAP
jgi:YVTN family beta-propeller protein